ncbi:hypothetical protein MTZ49_08905 [Entomomonas sp. E2T0]|uniref:hypothetical protein n=1 Tax=Entomomonas sp. E2T0 TaxID=2930213 RepID=UPI0022284127|nr:hypothetical protein [Entomomonas sp. E2T0]UYZ82734.1 hypothetical protein MTZ49_08905 [Entomomonas sp. E2T0]
MWRANPSNNQGKKYAIIEAKATAGIARPTTKYLASRLGVLSEKHKGKPVIQMDHHWVKQRVDRLMISLSPDIRADFRPYSQNANYSIICTRHIIAVSLLVEPGLSHIEAMMDDTKSDLDHAVHSGIVIHKYGEPTIENIIKEKRRRLTSKGNGNKPK